jgi:hypothetical protein
MRPESFTGGPEQPGLGPQPNAWMDTDWPSATSAVLPLFAASARLGPGVEKPFTSLSVAVQTPASASAEAS